MMKRLGEIVAAIRGSRPHARGAVGIPQVHGQAAKMIMAVALALLVVVAWLGYRYLQAERYGTISVVNGATTYKNHDLMVGVEETGRISLLGHGAYTKGFYAVNFNTVEGLKTFVAQKRTDFSDKQAQWLLWIIDHPLAVAPTRE